MLSEICSRSSEFISLAARTLRYGLDCGLAEVDHQAKADTINNLVSSWAYAAALQILDQTFTTQLALPESSLHVVEQKSDTPSSTAPTAESRSEVPRRSSSLIASTATRPSRAMTQDLSDLSETLHLQRRLTLHHP